MKKKKNKKKNRTELIKTILKNKKIEEQFLLNYIKKIICFY